MFETIPAIDIIEGKCVRLTKGDYSTKREYRGTPADLARRYADTGFTRLHLVDLDGAKAGKPCNLPALESIACAISGITLEWGGGLKTDADLKSAFSAGMTDAVIGSIAVKEPELFENWLARFSPQHIILGADVRDGRVAVTGWLEQSQSDISNLFDRFIPHGLSQSIVTEIGHDGMLQGPDFDLYTTLASRYPDIVLTVSGGISSLADVIKVKDLGLPRVIVGKAIYEGLIDINQLASLQC